MAIDQGHAVLPPPPATDGSAASQRQVAVPETSLLDVVLCDHRHTLTLFNHAAKVGPWGTTVA